MSEDLQRKVDEPDSNNDNSINSTANTKPDRKQWIPVYGLIKCFSDMSKGRPVVLTREATLSSVGWTLYQAISGGVAGSTIYYIISNLLAK